MKLSRPKKIFFLTGTRADFGKLLPLIRKVQTAHRSQFDAATIVCGMHTIPRFGSTYRQVVTSGIGKLHILKRRAMADAPYIEFADHVKGIGGLLSRYKPDLLVINGDRLEALAAAVAASTQNIRILHIEGGEHSGTLDESTRQAITRMAHIHMVANELFRQELIQIKEDPSRIFVIGSPEIDTMLAADCNPGRVLKKLKITFEHYAIAILHPVTTLSKKHIGRNAAVFFKSLKNSKRNYIVIYPNNDMGYEAIINEIQEYSEDRNFRIFPSLPFADFICLLKNADFIIGNSSAGIREAPVFGIPTINLGDRQKNRFIADSIHNVDFTYKEIKTAMEWALGHRLFPPNLFFGKGEAAIKFMKFISSSRFWNIPVQK